MDREAYVEPGLVLFCPFDDMDFCCCFFFFFLGFVYREKTTYFLVCKKIVYLDFFKYYFQFKKGEK